MRRSSRFATNLQFSQTAAIDFFTVPTATFRVLFVFVVTPKCSTRDAIYGTDFVAMTGAMGMEESAYCAAIPLAKSLGGAAGGLDPTRVPGPRESVE